MSPIRARSPAIKAKFDISGLYVWHCHIVEHEDNEMMRAYCVKNLDGSLPVVCRPSFGKPEKIGVFSSGQWLLDSNGNYMWIPRWTRTLCSALRATTR